MNPSRRCLIIDALLVHQPVIYREVKKHADNATPKIDTRNASELIEHFDSGRSLPIDDLHLVFSPLCNKTLNQFIVENRPNEERQSLFIQGLTFLSYLHKLNIMHMDIKPTNLMIFNPLRLVFIDFGSATDKLSSRDHYAGTIVYLAPEVLKLKQLALRRRKLDARRAELNPDLIAHNIYSRDTASIPFTTREGVFLRGLIKADKELKEDENRLDSEERYARDYTTAADIWALGLTFYQLFIDPVYSWHNGVDKDIYP